jgi:hypothetical protein
MAQRPTVRDSSLVGFRRWYVVDKQVRNILVIEASWDLKMVLDVKALPGQRCLEKGACVISKEDIHKEIR